MQYFFRFLFFISVIGLTASAYSQVRYTKNYHKNGNLKNEGNLNDGIKDGLWKYYNKDAVQVSQIVYKNGHQKTITIYHSNGDVKREILDYSDLGYGLSNTYENGFLKQRQWVNYRHNGKYELKTSYNRQIGSVMNWSKPNELKNWRYNIVMQQKGAIRESLPYFDFFEANRIRRIKYGKIELVFTDKGEFKAYTGPLDETGDIYNCAFQTYDGKVHITQNRKTVEKEIDIKSFIGMVNINIKDGLPDGLWKINYPNGKPFIKLNFNKGFLDGWCEIFHSNGKRKSKFNFENDLLNGEFKTWYRDGQLFADGIFTYGKMSGAWHTYTEKGGPLETYTIYERSFDGDYAMYYRDGQIRDQRTYVKGKINGPALLYNTDGSLREINTYYNGKKIKTVQYYGGVAMTIQEEKHFRFLYHSNGKLRALSYYDDLNGMGIFLDTTGQADNFSYSCHRGKIFDLAANFRDDTLYNYRYQIAGEDINLKPYSFVDNWPNSYQMMAGDSLNDKKTGSWTFYHPNGQIWAKGQYDNDLPDGKWEIFNLKGKKVSEHHFKSGVQHGIHKIWDENGVLYLDETYLMGEPEGKRLQYYPGTTQIQTSEFYKDGQLDGERLEYLENGTLFKSTHYKNGEREGLLKNYDKKEGHLVTTITYKNNKKDGPLKRYDVNKMLLSEVNYKRDLKHGSEKQYDGSGNLITEKQYYYGILLEKKTQGESCQCEAGDNSLTRGARYFPSVKNVVDWSDILFQLDGKIAVTKKLYEFTFYSGIQRESNYTSLNLINRHELVFENFDYPGLAFVLNPCLKDEEFSSIPLQASYDYPIGRLMDESYDPKSFKGLPLDYFEIAVKVNRFSVRDMYTGYYRLLTQELGTYDEYRIIKKMKADFEKHGIEINYQWTNYDAEKLIAETASKRAEFYNMIFEEYFNVGTLDREYFPDEFLKFNRSFKAFFERTGQYKYQYQIDELFEKTLSVRFGNKKLGIDFPLDLLTPLSPSTHSHSSGKSRLTMTVKTFGYDLQDGLTLTGANDFCFTPSQFTGTDLNISFDSVRVEFNGPEHKYLFRIAPEPTDHSNFLKAHKINANPALLVPHATGQWTDTNSKHQFDVIYEMLSLEGHLIAGRISVKKSKGWSDQIQNAFARQFTAFEVLENSDENLTAMFVIKT